MEIKRFSLKMIVVCWLALGAICCCWCSPALALNGATVAIYNDKLPNGTERGVWQAGLTAYESMLTWAGITYEEITASDLNSSTINLSSLYETIIIPGGNAAYYNGYYGGDYINATGKANIRDFVDNGGGYLGICAGAYFACDEVIDNGTDVSSWYTLDLFPGKGIGPLNEIANYNDGLSAMATVNFTGTNDVLSGYKSTPYSEDILYFGGPYFSINSEATVQTLATYEFNDEAAVVAFTYGSGKVVLFGPHPEIEEDSTRDGTTYGDSFDDNDSEWKLMQYVLSYLGAGEPNSVSGGYSRYDFTYNYNDNSGDYYTGYVYAPTAFQTSSPLLTVGTYIYDQPMEMWASYKSLNGGSYHITGITDGYDSSYDKVSYITSYYDANGAQASLNVNKDGSAILNYVNGHILVANRTLSMEYGYAVSGSNYATFSPYLGANVTIHTPSGALSSLAPTATSTSASAAQSLAVWGAYWNEISGLLD